MMNENRSLFVPPLSPAQPLVTSEDRAFRSSDYFNDKPLVQDNSNRRRNFQLDDVFRTATDMIRYLPPVGVTVNVGDRSDRRTNKPTKPTTNEPGGRSKMSSGHSSGYALSKAPNPSITKLDSGIVPNLYTSDYLDAKEGHCSPLHISCVKMVIPTSASQKVYDYFLKVIAFDIQTKAQSNIGFNLKVDTEFTAASILTALNSVMSALQIYFYHMSVISYHSEFQNKNEGMINLRSSITGLMIEDLTLLGRRLADTPVPPRLYELIRYLSNTYYSGDNQGSALLKMCPFPATANMVSGQAIKDAFTDLSSTQNNLIYSLLRRAVPQWKPEVLFDVNPIPPYDSNYLTIFANLPQSTSIGALQNVPTAAATDTVIAYNTFTNTLDGVAYALTSVAVSNDWQPGLMTAVNTAGFENNRRSFYEVSSVKGWYNSIDYTFITRSRPETYILNEAKTAVLSLHLVGADKCLGVSSDTIRETALKVLDYLMSLDTIKTNKLSNFASNTMPQSGRRTETKRDRKPFKRKGITKVPMGRTNGDQSLD